MIDRMHRYPAHLIDVTQLANGARIILRPILPQDAELQRAFVRTLSEEARYFRFMTRLKELPEAMAERFARIDYRKHMALIATRWDGAVETMIGEARYVMDDGDEAEFAVAVADAWHGLGIAGALLAGLISHAASHDIRRLVGDTASNNRPMMAFAKRAGFTAQRLQEDGRVVRLVRELPVQHPHASVLGLQPGEWGIAA